MTHRQFTFEQISTTFSYNAEEGKLWRRLVSGKLRECNLVCEVEGRSWLRAAQIGFKGYLIISSHIIFMLKTKRWPYEGMVIDHRDGYPGNARWNNLREATALQNNANRLSNGRWADNEEGLEMCVRPKGVMYHVRVGQTFIGSYALKSDANKAAIEARGRIFGEFIRFKRRV